MALPWSEVEKSKDYLSLEPQDRLEAQREYFTNVVAVKPEFQSLAPQDQQAAYNEFLKPKGNIFTDIAKGVARGSQTTLAYGLGQPLISLGQASLNDIPRIEKNLGRPLEPDTKAWMEQTNANNKKLMETGEKIKQFFLHGAQTGIEAPQVGLPLHRRVASAVGESIPLMIPAAGITAAAATAGAPALVAGLAGASVFGPQAYGQHYDEQRAAGVSHEKASNLALANMAIQVGLEAALPLSGWLRGGSLTKRMIRGAWQEGGEEVLQQWSENALRAIGYRPLEGKSIGEIAKQINEGTLEAGLAGAIMGGGLGVFSPPTLEEVKYDAKQKVAKIITNNAKAENMTPAQTQAAIDEQHKLIDDYLTPKRYESLQEKLRNGAIVGKGLLTSVIDITSPSPEGGSITAEIPGIDLEPRIKVQATNLAVQAFDRMKITPSGGKELRMTNIPPTMREIIVGRIGELINSGVPVDNIHAEAEEVIKKLLNEKTIYLLGGGKTDVEGKVNDPEFVVWYPGLRKQITLRDLGNLQADYPDLANLKIVYSRSPQQKSINDSVLRTLKNEYQKALADRALLKTPTGDIVPVQEVEKGVQVAKELAPVIEQAQIQQERPPEAPIAEQVQAEMPQALPPKEELEEAGIGPTVPSDKILNFVDTLRALKEQMTFTNYRAIIDQQIQDLYQKLYPKKKTSKGLIARQEEAQAEASSLQQKISDLRESGANPEKLKQLIAQYNGLMDSYNSPNLLQNQINKINQQIEHLSNIPISTNEEFANTFYRGELRQQYTQMTRDEKNYAIESLRTQGLTDKQIEEFIGETPTPSPETLVMEKNSDLIEEDNEAMIDTFEGKEVTMPPLITGMGAVAEVSEEITLSSGKKLVPGKPYGMFAVGDTIRMHDGSDITLSRDELIELIQASAENPDLGITFDPYRDPRTLFGNSLGAAEAGFVEHKPSVDKPMYYKMPANQNLTGKDTTTLELAEQGLRTSTTRGQPLGAIGDIVTFEGKPIRYRITGLHRITTADMQNPEFIRNLSKTEQWTEEAIRTRHKFQIKPGAWVTNYEKEAKSVGAAAVGDVSFAAQDYNQQKMLRGVPIELDDRYGPRNLPIKLALETMRFFKFQSQTMRFLEDFFGKEKVKRTVFKRKAVSLQDDIITNVFQDRMFRQYATHVAWDQMQPVFKTIWERVMQDMSNDPQFQAVAPKDRTKLAQEKVTEIVRFLNDAHEEVFTKKGLLTPAGLRIYQLTDIGLGGAHWTPEESAAFVERLKYAADSFHISDDELRTMYNIPAATPVWDYLKATRPEAAFFTLITNPKISSDNTLQNLVLWTKGEVEYPMLERQLAQGVFKNANTWASMIKGFMHRGWAYTPEQKRTFGRGVTGSMGKVTVEPAKYRTYQEFLSATGAWKPGETQLRGVELSPYDNYISNMQEYVTDSLMNIQQLQTLEWLGKQQVPFDKGRQLKGFENNQAVNDIIATTNLVEYKGSPTIQKLIKLTGLEEDAILQDLGYLQTKNEPGLVKWYRGIFEAPYLYRPLGELIASVYEPKNRQGHPVTNANAVFNSIKRILTVNPFDSTFLWMSAVIANNTPIESVALLPKYFKSIYTGISKVGPDILAGRDWISGDIESFENLPLFIKHGFTAINYEKAMASLWDELELGKYPEMTTPWERSKEYAISVGGVNAAIFNGFIAKELYHVLNKRYQSFLNQNMDPDTAARRAVKLINDTSFLLNPEVFGKEGKYWTLALFTRNLTIGAMRIASGAAYPLLKKTGLYKYRTHGIGKTFNSFVHAETSAADMNFLSKYYIAHVGKVLTMKLLADSMIQYALSFADPDNKDKPIDDKDRIMFFNEPGRRLSIKTPWKDNNQRRVFLDFQYLREAQWLGNLFARSYDGAVQSAQDNANPLEGAAASAFEYAKDWSVNRINTAGKWFANMLLNYDSHTGRQITDRNLPPQYQNKETFDWLKQQMIPLGFEGGHTTDKFSTDAMLRAIEIFGGARRYGEAAEQEKMIPKKQEWERQSAIVDYFNRKVAGKLQEMPLSKIPEEVGPAFTPESARGAMRKKQAPIHEFFKRNRSKIKRFPAVGE